MMMILAHVRESFAASFFPRWSEWWAAWVLFLLGILLTYNVDLMASSKTQAYNLMLMIASQATWATLMKWFAVARLTVLFINGAWRRSPHLRAIMAFLTCFFWMQITLSFQPSFGFAFVLSGSVLMLDFVNMIRAARDARTIDHIYAEGRNGSGQGNPH